MKFISINHGRDWFEYDRSSVAIRSLEVRADPTTAGTYIKTVFELVLWNDDFKTMQYGHGLHNSLEEAAKAITVKDLEVTEVKK